MAFRRFFSPSRSRSRSRDQSPARSPTSPITITHLHPPAGDFYLTPPDGVQSFPTGSSAYEDTVLLNGRIEVTLAAGSGPRRIKSIRAGLVTISTLDLGPGRKDEEDTIFEAAVDVASGMVLEEGAHAFDWRIRVPRTLAAHDFHPEGRVTHTIFAIIEIITPSRSRPTTRTSSPRPSMSRIPSLAEVSSASSSRMPSYAESSSASSSRMPSYAESSTSGAPLTPVVSGTHTPPYEDTVEIVKGKRTCMVVHENPGEGVINLDLKGEGLTPGLGVYNQHYTSDIWTICALFNYRLVFPDPAPHTTVHAIAVSLEQTTSLKSPRDPEDAEPVVRTKIFELCAQGATPPPNTPLRHTGALWSGNAGESCVIEGNGRLPNDEYGRPSTPLGTITPLRVSHHLIMKVWFSVFGEDAYGNSCDPAQTELRLLTLRRPVMIPSCALIPDVVDLPSYETIEDTVAPQRTDDPCFICDKYYSVKDYIAHHKGISGSIPQGECKLCGRKIVLGFDKGTEGKSGMWRYCACGLSLADMEERMKRVAALAPAGGQVDEGTGAVMPVKSEYRG